MVSNSTFLAFRKSCTSCPNWGEVIWTKSKRTAVFLGLLPLLTLLGILSQGISAGAFYTKRAGEKILSGGDNVWGDATPHLATIMDQTAVWISTLTTSHHSHQRCLLI